MTAGGADEAVELLAALRGHGLSAACAESLTGGLVAAAITSVPGASTSFRGGVVAYATEVKHTVLGVSREVLEEHGPVSEPTAAAMAQAVAPLMGADVGLATTGVAGPDPVGPLAAGRAYVAVCRTGTPAVVRRLDVMGDRAAVRAACVGAVLELAVQVLAAEAAGGE